MPPPPPSGKRPHAAPRGRMVVAGRSEVVIDDSDSESSFPEPVAPSSHVSLAPAQENPRPIHELASSNVQGTKAAWESESNQHKNFSDVSSTSFDLDKHGSRSPANALDSESAGVPTPTLAANKSGVHIRKAVSKRPVSAQPKQVRPPPPPTLKHAGSEPGMVVRHSRNRSITSDAVRRVMRIDSNGDSTPESISERIITRPSSRKQSSDEVSVSGTIAPRESEGISGSPLPSTRSPGSPTDGKVVPDANSPSALQQQSKADENVVTQHTRDDQGIPPSAAPTEKVTLHQTPSSRADSPKHDGTVATSSLSRPSTGKGSLKQRSSRRAKATPVSGRTFASPGLPQHSDSNFDNADSIGGINPAASLGQMAEAVGMFDSAKIHAERVENMRANLDASDEDDNLPSSSKRKQESGSPHPTPAKEISASARSERNAESSTRNHSSRNQESSQPLRALGGVDNDTTLGLRMPHTSKANAEGEDHKQPTWARKWTAAPTALKRLQIASSGSTKAKIQQSITRALQSPVRFTKWIMESTTRRRITLLIIALIIFSAAVAAVSLTSAQVTAPIQAPPSRPPAPCVLDQPCIVNQLKSITTQEHGSFQCRGEELLRCDDGTWVQQADCLDKFENDQGSGARMRCTCRASCHASQAACMWRGVCEGLLFEQPSSIPVSP